MRSWRARNHPAINAAFVTRGARGISNQDVEGVVRNADAIRRKFERPGPLGRFISDARLLLAIVRDYGTGEYRAIPWWAVAAIAFALLYVLSPVDLIPDALPVIGVVDDAAVVSVCLALVEQQLQEYKRWKLNNPG